ncbi:MAG: 3-hydroxyacyl-ACP dehydratase FabZ [Elusimicrobia bacterium]|nr:3-hydroxyacyl-ACP dehydratase FabZ [Elusimicrobiota bacterium]
MLNANEILKIIPHRYPFLMVDRVEIIDDLKSAKGIKCVSANELFFHGHFPERPIMPGVLILESMAQTSATLMVCSPEYSGRFAYFAGINKARFRKQVIPGDVLEIYINVERIRGKIAKVSGLASVRDNKVCDAELIFAVD